MRIKKQETCLTLHEHDDDDDDVCHLNYVYDIGNLILEQFFLFYIVIYAVLYICTPGICFLCIALCGVLCFECCKTPRVLKVLYYCCVYCKENFTPINDASL